MRGLSVTTRNQYRPALHVQTFVKLLTFSLYLMIFTIIIIVTAALYRTLEHYKQGTVVAKV